MLAVPTLKVTLRLSCSKGEILNVGHSLTLLLQPRGEVQISSRGSVSTLSLEGVQVLFGSHGFDDGVQLC